MAGQAQEMEARCGPYRGEQCSHLGHRTFGIGKFHTRPWNEDLGYETLWRSEETYHPHKRQGDDYALWLAREHPEFDFLEQPLGERSEMYYLPQRSPLPAELGVESWAADRAVQEITNSDDPRPFFGFVSFCRAAPTACSSNSIQSDVQIPIESQRLVLGSVEEDHLDEEIPYMRYAVLGRRNQPGAGANREGQILRRDQLSGSLPWPNPRRDRSAAEIGECSYLLFFRPWRSFG